MSLRFHVVLPALRSFLHIVVNKYAFKQKMNEGQHGALGTLSCRQRGEEVPFKLNFER